MVWGIKYFHPYLLIKHFEVITDHYSLKWLRTTSTESALLHQWSSNLEEYGFTIKHWLGKLQTGFLGHGMIMWSSSYYTMFEDACVTASQQTVNLSGDYKRRHNRRTSSNVRSGCWEGMVSVTGKEVERKVAAM